jgi:hypothetical protein
MDSTRTGAGSEADPAPTGRREAVADELDVQRVLAALHGDDEELPTPRPRRVHGSSCAARHRSGPIADEMRTGLIVLDLLDDRPKGPPKHCLGL